MTRKSDMSKGKGDVELKRRIEFEIGQRYTNRKGTYEVLEVEGNSMQIRWETGEEATTSVKMQIRILENMERELDYPALNMFDTPPKISKTTRSLPL